MQKKSKMEDTLLGRNLGRSRLERNGKLFKCIDEWIEGCDAGKEWKGMRWWNLQFGSLTM